MFPIFNIDMPSKRIYSFCFFVKKDNLLIIKIANF